MHVGRVVAQLPLFHRLDAEQAVDGSFHVDGVWRAVFLRFGDSAVRPITAVDIVRGSFVTQQVQRQRGKLCAGTAVAEQDFIIGGDFQQIAQVLFGLLSNFDKLFTAMADFHHRGAKTVPVAQLLFRTTQNFNRQHGRTRAKIINLSHFPSPHSLFANETGLPKYARTNPSVLSLAPPACNGYSPAAGKRVIPAITGSAKSPVIFAIKRCDSGQFSGLTRFFMLYSADMAGGRAGPRMKKRHSVLIKHLLNLFGVFGLRQRQLQQDPRFLRV
ncbi:hypothetical protein D3C78_973200 [compost metagenome]